MTARTLAALLIPPLLLLGPAPLAAAQESPSVTWGVRPADNALGKARPNFGYTAAPGAVIADELLVTNHERRALTFRVYAADAFTTSSGQLDLLPAGTPSEHVGTWVAFGQGEVTVQAGQTVPVPFTVSVPASATPGDHSGGVVTSLGVADASSGITVDRRLGSRMHVRVGGALAPSLEVRDLTVDYAGSANPVGPGSAKVSYTVVNTGNTRLTATQSVRVEGPFGWLGADAEAAALPELLPGESATREAVASVPPSGRITAAVTLVSMVPGGTVLEPVVGTGDVLAIPWAAVISLLLLLCAALGLRARARARRAGEERRIAAAVDAALNRDQAGSGTSQIGRNTEVEAGTEAEAGPATESDEAVKP
ncbi:DUF916 domain-containing protein [Actinosynnema pretiosum subsp. pretiosum]|uniref:DUF916 domain-containing protein n=1 Tax=Actinosynnema pretiosum subsp. pretiosum TaxID=103721 RepID=A0AA45L8H4_9PSEU|nr:hypothetical protein APASM_2899 [Actinosynnema pretiosum subsp. pretiosum]QUF05579.1 DUF916 domain-containing protein [Actinosynnema pretiosum subsp. pretiosum]